MFTYKTFLSEDIDEGTVAADVSQATGKMGDMKKDCPCKEDPDSEACKKVKAEKEMMESPVGAIGRTGFADADAHVTDALRAEFKKIVRKLGGKTVARKLLAEMNAGGLKENIKGGLKSDMESMLQTIQTNCYSKKMEAAIDEVLDLMDTDC
jgi:hypothetical protein